MLLEVKMFSTMYCDEIKIAEMLEMRMKARFRLSMVQ